MTDLDLVLHFDDGRMLLNTKYFRFSLKKYKYLFAVKGFVNVKREIIQEIKCLSLGPWVGIVDFLK